MRGNAFSFSINACSHTRAFVKCYAEKQNIRLTDIARMANVSVGTVDRVIHNRGRVSEENIRRVKEIMEQVGYKPNLIARSLAVKSRAIWWR